MTCMNQPADHEEPTQTNKTRRSKIQLSRRVGTHQTVVLVRDLDQDP